MMFENFFNQYPVISFIVLLIWMILTSYTSLYSFSEYHKEDLHDWYFLFMGTLMAFFLQTLIAIIIIACLNPRANPHCFIFNVIFLSVNSFSIAGLIYLQLRPFFQKRFTSLMNCYQEWKSKIDILASAKHIYKKGKITAGEKVKLEKVIQEYEILNREILSQEKKLNVYQATLSKVQVLHEQTLQLERDELDKDLKASYFVSSEELTREYDEMKSLVSNFQKQGEEQKARRAEILKLFKQAKEKAQSYQKYDFFIKEALQTQKEVKELILTACDVK